MSVIAAKLQEGDILQGAQGSQVIVIEPVDSVGFVTVARLALGLRCDGEPLRLNADEIALYGFKPITLVPDCLPA